MQWNNGIWWWGCSGGGNIVIVNAGDAVNSEYYVTFLHQRQCPHHHIPLFHCIHHIHCIHWFDLFAPKTMFPPSYSTIPLCPLHPLVWPFCTKDNVPSTICHYSTMSTISTASTGLTFLHERQCPHHHIPLFHCVNCIYCVHCIHCVPSSHLCVILTQLNISIHAINAWQKIIIFPCTMFHHNVVGR